MKKEILNKWKPIFQADVHLNDSKETVETILNNVSFNERFTITSGDSISSQVIKNVYSEDELATFKTLFSMIVDGNKKQ